MRRHLILFALALAVAVPAAALAAPNGRRQQRQEELREKIRAVRIARLIEALNLDADGATRLMPILDRGYDQIAVIARESGAARRELRQLLQTDRPNEARVNQLVDQLVANRGRVEAIQQEMLRGVRTVLPPRQVGRLVLVLPEIERQIQQQIRRAAQGAMQRGGPDLPPPDDDDAP